jgi:hypothetical protein
MSNAAKIDEMQKAVMRLPRPPAAIGDGPDERVGYVLDLVSRLGKALEGKLWRCNHVLSHDASCKSCLEARALLKELEL